MASHNTPEPDDAPQRRHWGRILLLPVILLLGVLMISVFNVDHYLTFDALAANRARLLHLASENFLLSIVAFLVVYVAVTALSIPGASIVTMMGGFLFGSVTGTIIAVISATLGASLLFAIARTSLGEVFRDRSRNALSALKEGFKKDAFSYLLFLRLVPLFPFWLINLVAAFLDIRLRIFFFGTLIGIIPGTAVFASVGSGLGAILDRGERPDLNIIFSPAILIPVLALAVLSLVPAAYRRLRRV